MTRLPWEHGPTHRTHEDDGGESLNADVMRFVAILALCLVALFALVRSIPLAAPVAPASSPARSPATLPPAPVAAEITMPRPPPPSSPEVDRSPLQPQSPVGDVKAEPPAVPEAPAPPPIAPPESAQASPVQVETPPAQAEGFTLRFESDQALQRLIADARVRVYARPEGGGWWVTAGSRVAQFHTAAAPVQIYEMAASTVPRAMVDALGRDRGLAVSGPVLWGVSLPPDIETRIEALIEDREGGRLVIDAGGGVTLSPHR
jgi:hypothetical protein